MFNMSKNFLLEFSVFFPFALMSCAAVCFCFRCKVTHFYCIVSNYLCTFFIFSLFFFCFVNITHTFFVLLHIFISFYRYFHVIFRFYRIVCTICTNCTRTLYIYGKRTVKRCAAHQQRHIKKEHNHSQSKTYCTSTKGILSNLLDCIPYPEAEDLQRINSLGGSADALRWVAHPHPLSQSWTD